MPASVSSCSRMILLASINSVSRSIGCVSLRIFYSLNKGISLRRPTLLGKYSLSVYKGLSTFADWQDLVLHANKVA
ncbi:hypothetical protein AL524_25000 [Citrobacter amalonaticus]|nr:hypothetical protein AL524_25000 [Citrobacter amalonaticus]